MFTSGWIFRLASDFGIPLEKGGVSEMSDAELVAFQNEYSLKSKSRDLALVEHTKNNPSLFRIYLPYSEQAYKVTTQIAWYLDEIIIRDPISGILKSLEDNPEEAKLHLRHHLQFIFQYRSLIENGFILLAGATTLDDVPESPTPFAESLFADSKVRSEMEKIARWGYVEKEDGTGFAYQLKLPVGGFIKMVPTVNIPSGEGWASPVIDFRDGLPEIDYQDLQLKLNKNLIEENRDIFLGELQIPILSASNAHKMGAALMLTPERAVYGTILDKSGTKLETNRQAASVQALNLTLPYVSGIPLDRLLDVRYAAPGAFTDFRSRIADIVINATGEDAPTQAYLKHQVAKEIDPLIGSLESEMESTLKRAGIIGLGVPIIAGTGILTGSILGVPISYLLAAAAGGAISSLGAFATSEEAKAKAKGHPGYFLWSAKKLK